MTVIPERFKLLFSREQIKQEVARIGSELTPWSNEVQEQTGKDLLCLPILRGGIFFFADLVREIQGSIDMAAIKAQAYELGQNAVQTNQVSFSSDSIDPEGRGVLLVDDICDSGRTLQTLTESFKKRGAHSVRSVVLIKRAAAQEFFNPDFVGFSYQGPEWFVGYGMDDSDRWRNLASIYIIIQ